MRQLTMRIITAMFILATGFSAAVIYSQRRGDWVEDVQNELSRKLSGTAEIYLPGSNELEEASTRWSVLEQPKATVAIVPGTSNDVAEIVKFANKRAVPFLAYSGRHGAITTLGKMDYGIGIFLEQLNSIEIANDGKTAKIGGGANTKFIIDTLWKVGKQTVTGACECVSFLGPALGGGHGLLQGQYGLIADQFVSMDIVLANGRLATITPKSDLFWAMKGAGHNFGIVTSVTTKIFDNKHRDWVIEAITFSGNKVEAVYQAANDNLLKNGTQPVDIINWSFWFNNPDAGPSKPVIVFYILQEGVTAVDPATTKPFHDIGPLAIEPIAGTYKDIATWASLAIDSPACQKEGLANTRFPIYLVEYDVAAQKKAYDLFASEANGATPFSNSLFLFEGYSLQGVKAIDSESTAFAYRGDNLLISPVITYSPTDAALDKKAADLGEKLREILREGSNREESHVYVNYAFGNETPKDWYGGEQWRQDRLRMLKKKYDPRNRFGFYAPIA